jgi:ATP-dependent DNA ligase
MIQIRTMAFELLIADGVDLRPLPLKQRKVALARLGVVEADLEGIVAKHLDDAYHPKLARWDKVLNRGYSQRRGRAEWFRELRGLHAGRR